MIVDLDEYCSIFEKYGDPGRRYLEASFERFQITRSYVLEALGERRGALVDIGAHWLHNCLLYRLDGFDVTACDLLEPGEMESNPTVHGVADAFDIVRISYADLADPVELAALPESSVDVVLFTETIEHLTFNPARMWRQIHRLMKPGARLILTTPNFFYPGHWTKELFALCTGRSTGLPVDEILRWHTYAHHWKVYSARDLRDYFAAISSDFEIARLSYFSAQPAVRFLGAIARAPGRWIPGLRQSIYLEVRLAEKREGVRLEPRWS